MRTERKDGSSASQSTVVAAAAAELHVTEGVPTVAFVRANYTVEVSAGCKLCTSVHGNCPSNMQLVPGAWLLGEGSCCAHDDCGFGTWV